MAVLIIVGLLAYVTFFSLLVLVALVALRRKLEVVSDQVTQLDESHRILWNRVDDCTYAIQIIPNRIVEAYERTLSERNLQNERRNGNIGPSSGPLDSVR